MESVNVLRFKVDGNTITNSKIIISPVELKDSNGEIYAPENVFYSLKDGYCHLIFRVNNVYIEVADFYLGNTPLMKGRVEQYLSQVSPENLIEKIFSIERPNLLFIEFIKALNLDYEQLSLKRNNYDIERRKIEQEEREVANKRKIEEEYALKIKYAERMNHVYSLIQNGDSVLIKELIELAKYMGITIHARTIGALNNLGSDSSIKKSQISYSIKKGKKLNCDQTLFKIYHLIQEMNAPC